MSANLLPKNVSDRKKIVRSILASTEFKFDEEMSHSVFFTDAHGLIYGVSFGEDSYIGINFAMAVDEPVDNAKRIAAVNYINSEYKVLKCYYADISLILSSEAFLGTESGFLEFFNYSISAIRGAYLELEEKYPGAL